MIRASSRKTAAGRLLFCGGVLALLIPAIAGCEAGSDAPTLQFHSASSGAHAIKDGIQLTNVFVLGAPADTVLPSGSSAGLFLSLYNRGSSDTLESITAPGTAASVTLPGGSVALPADAAPVNLTGPQPQAVLTNLSKPLTGGSNITLFLQFQHAGQVRLVVPVMAQNFYFETYSQAPGAPVNATPTASPSASPTGS